MQEKWRGLRTGWCSLGYFLRLRRKAGSLESRLALGCGKLKHLPNVSNRDIQKQFCIAGTPPVSSSLRWKQGCCCRQSLWPKAGKSHCGAKASVHALHLQEACLSCKSTLFLQPGIRAASLGLGAQRLPCSSSFLRHTQGGSSSAIDPLFVEPLDALIKTMS